MNLFQPLENQKVWSCNHSIFIRFYTLHHSSLSMVPTFLSRVLPAGPTLLKQNDIWPQPYQLTSGFAPIKWTRQSDQGSIVFLLTSLNLPRANKKNYVKSYKGIFKINCIYFFVCSYLKFKLLSLFFPNDISRKKHTKFKMSLFGNDFLIYLW